MSIYLFVFFLSFIANIILFIPFINLLYRLKFQRAPQVTRDAFNKITRIFDRFHAHKAGTPVGGGVLIVATTILLFVASTIWFILIDQKIISNYADIVIEIKILLFTFISFSFLGLYDDLKKIFLWREDSLFGLRLRFKLLIVILLAAVVSFWLYKELNVDLINIPFFGVYNLGLLYPVFSSFVIVAFANAVNVTDGLDGLASGCLLIALLAFWAVSSSILDTPLLLFIAVWLGGLLAFLYFNIFPARLFLGDTGALSFGATFAVIGLLLGKSFALPIIGGIFVIEITTSLLQLLSKKIRGKKLFPVSPLHLWLQLRGWEEPKIVMRGWMVSALFALFGLMVAFMK